MKYVDNKIGSMLRILGISYFSLKLIDKALPCAITHNVNHTSTTQPMLTPPLIYRVYFGIFRKYNRSVICLCSFEN